MKTNKTQVSLTQLHRLRVQGYSCQTNEELGDLAFGNRFAFQLCVSLVIVGTLSTNIYILAAMMLVAFLAVLLPYHPFDYIYNYLLANRLGKPQLPKRSPQLKFACGLAAPWLGGTIYLFLTQQMVAGYLLVSALIVTGLLVSTIDFCIPSMIYNSLFRTKTATSINF